MHDLLRVDDLVIEFSVATGTIKAVDGVSFRVPRGKTVALVGESGSGKSVISQAIMGILPRNGRIVSGSIAFDHDEDAATPRIDITALNPSGAEMRALQGRHMSIIFQEPMSSLSPLHTIGDQVGETLRQHLQISPGEADERTLQMLELVGFPDPHRAFDAYPFELSGGLRQRAMIAMALICRPALLIADEPTTALDVTIQAQILALISELQTRLRMAVLLITHDLGVVANIADEIVVMYRGKILEAGPREVIFRDPAHPYLQALLAAVPHMDMPLDARLKPLHDIGQKLEKPLRAKPVATEPGPPLLQIRNLCKGFESRHRNMFGNHGDDTISAVDDVSFDIPRGECVGLVGESGCGKTTLAKMIMRAIPADAGSVQFDGADVFAITGPALKEYRRRAQYIFQDPFSSLNSRMTIFDILTEPLIIHGIGNRRQRRKRAAELMGMVGLDPDCLSRYPHSFSGGQRQRIGIARALALQPELLICDEPVSALDVSVQAQILNLLKDLKEQLGLTFLFVSHNLAVVRYITDRIMVMCKGRLVETATRDELFRNPTHPYTRALLAAVPAPDPDLPLDFDYLSKVGSDGPVDWPAPYRVNPAYTSRMKPLSDTHFVRVFDAA